MARMLALFSALFAGWGFPVRAIDNDGAKWVQANRIHLGFPESLQSSPHATKQSTRRNRLGETVPRLSLHNRCRYSQSQAASVLVPKVVYG
jgi:hypothetical protein